MSYKNIWHDKVSAFINNPKNKGKSPANGVLIAMITTLKAVMISKGLMTEEDFYKFCIDALDQNERNPSIPTPYSSL